MTLKNLKKIFASLFRGNRNDFGSIPKDPTQVLSTFGGDPRDHEEDPPPPFDPPYYPNGGEDECEKLLYIKCKYYCETLKPGSYDIQRDNKVLRWEADIKICCCCSDETCKEGEKLIIYDCPPLDSASERGREIEYGKITCASCPEAVSAPGLPDLTLDCGGGISFKLTGSKTIFQPDYHFSDVMGLPGTQDNAPMDISDEIAEHCNVKMTTDAGGNSVPAGPLTQEQADCLNATFCFCPPTPQMPSPAQIALVRGIVIEDILNQDIMKDFSDICKEGWLSDGDSTFWKIYERIEKGYKGRNPFEILSNDDCCA